MNELILISLAMEEFELLIKKAIREEVKYYPSEQPEKFLNVEEAAIYLKISKSHLYKLTMNRRIPYYKPSKIILFKKSELDDWIKRFRVQTEEEIDKEAEIYLMKNKK